MTKLNEPLLEAPAKAELENLAENLTKIGKQSAETFQKSLEKSGLTSDVKEKASNIFSQTILKRLGEVSKSLEDFKKQDHTPYKIMLSEKVIDILSAVQDFKKEIDKKLPISSDQLLKYAAPALMILSTFYAPSIAVVLRATGIAEKAASFLETGNLEKTINSLRDNLEKTKAEMLKGKAGEIGGQVSRTTGDASTKPIAVKQKGNGREL